MKSGHFLRQAPRIALRARGQSHVMALRFASSQASPRVDEIEFELLGDPATATYPSRPFASKTREQLEKGVKAKAQDLTRQWESKFTSQDLNAVLAKDVFQFKPNDEKALQEELNFIEHPSIQATVDTAFNTKDHKFLTDFLTSRTASYLEDPTLYFSYGERPSATLKPNWAESLHKNFTTIEGLAMLEDFSTASADYQEFNRLRRQLKEKEEEEVEKLQTRNQTFSDPELIAKAFTPAGLSPDQMKHMIELSTTDSIDEKYLALLKKQIAERDQHNKESVVMQQVDEYTALARELVKQIEASGIPFDYAKVSF